MNYQRIWTLTKLDIRRIFFSRSSILLLYAPFLVITMVDLGLGWNGRSATLFTIPIEACCDSKEKAILGILHEHFSWLWMFLAFSHLLSQLLSRLQDSFLVSQLLWLRFTPCLPYEVAISRSLKVIIYGLWVGILGITWGLINAFIHQVSLHSLLLDTLGISSYIFLSGGIVTILDFGLLLGDSERRVISNIALFLPILLLMLFTLIKDSVYGKYFPFSAPFITSSETFTEIFGGVQSHFITATILGLLLLLFHVVSKYSISKHEARHI
jgi:hypothetical protein